MIISLLTYSKQIAIYKLKVKKELLKRRDNSNNVEIFKNNTTFFNFPDMFRRYIRHRQCNG